MNKLLKFGYFINNSIINKKILAKDEIINYRKMCGMLVHGDKDGIS